MQYVKNGDSMTRAVIDRFCGLDRSGPLCRESAFELRNFRLLSDGSLERREGARVLAHLSDAIRGATSIRRDGVYESYVVAGQTVYYLARESEEYVPQSIGELGTATGSVEFFYHSGVLVLMDGAEMWSVTPTSLEKMEAYVPLYGKDWSQLNTEDNVVNEKPNLLSKRLRIRYRLTANTNMVNLNGLSCVTCDGLFIDGVKSTNHYFNKSGGTISLGRQYPVGTVVDVFVSMADTYLAQRPTICQARRMAGVGNLAEERAMLYDIPDDKQVWIGHSTAREDRVMVRKAFPNCCMIYLTEKDKYSIGKSNVEVTGVCHQYDRSLIFTAGETWMADGEEYENGALRMVTVNSTQGCTSRDACATLGNTPLSICDNRILAWNSHTDERDECNAVSISLPIEPLLGESFATKGAVCVNPARNEVWFYLPGEASRILIWQADSKTWTSFDGFVADRLFCLGDHIGFYRGNTLYCLDDPEGEDTDETGVRRSVEGEYLSSYLDFGQPTAIKHVTDADVFAQCDAGEMTLVLQRADGKRTETYVQGEGQQLSLMHCRVNVGRFRFLRAGFYTPGQGGVRVFGLRVTARH